MIDRMRELMAKEVPGMGACVRLDAKEQKNETNAKESPRIGLRVE